MEKSLLEKPLVASAVNQVSTFCGATSYTTILNPAYTPIWYIFFILISPYMRRFPLEIFGLNYFMHLLIYVPRLFVKAWFYYLNISQ